MSSAANLAGNYQNVPSTQTAPLQTDATGNIVNAWSGPYQLFFALLGQILSTLAQNIANAFVIVDPGTGSFQPNLAVNRSFQITLTPTGVMIENPANIADAVGGFLVFLIVQPGNYPGPTFDTEYIGVQANDPFTVDPGVGTFSSLVFFNTGTELVLVTSLTGAHWS